MCCSTSLFIHSNMNWWDASLTNYKASRAGYRLCLLISWLLFLISTSAVTLLTCSPDWCHSWRQISSLVSQIMVSGRLHTSAKHWSISLKYAFKIITISIWNTLLFLCLLVAFLRSGCKPPGHYQFMDHYSDLMSMLMFFFVSFFFFFYHQIALQEIIMSIISLIGLQFTIRRWLHRNFVCVTMLELHVCSRKIVALGPFAFTPRGSCSGGKAETSTPAVRCWCAGVDLSHFRARLLCSSIRSLFMETNILKCVNTYSLCPEAWFTI